MFGFKNKAHTAAEHEVYILKSVLRQKARQIKNKVAKIDDKITADPGSEHKYYVVSERLLSDLLFDAEVMEKRGQE